MEENLKILQDEMCEIEDLRIGMKEDNELMSLDEQLTEEQIDNHIDNRKIELRREINILKKTF